MEILAHPLFNGEYIVYLLDNSGRPLLADIKKSKKEILKQASQLSKQNGSIVATYLDSPSADSKKPKWKILSH
jgi:hypothetical protein